MGLHGGLRGSMWVVGAINQSKYVPMMSLAVVGTLTNQILWVYTRLCGSTRAYAEVYMEVYAEVYAGLHGGLRRWWGPLTNQNMCQ